MSEDEIFGPVISRYTDKQAVEDGVLVDISSWKLSFRGKPVNRMTTAVWHELEPFAVGETSAQKMQSFKHMIQTKLEHVVEGEIVQVPPHYWLIENEIDGWTLMLPSDY